MGVTHEQTKRKERKRNHLHQQIKNALSKSKVVENKYKHQRMQYYKITNNLGKKRYHFLYDEVRKLILLSRRI